jgi:voltage-gated potassium channel
MTKTMTTSDDRRIQFLDAYAAKTDLLLSALALVYLVLFSLQAIFYYPDDTWFQWANVFGYILWILFAADLLFRIALTPRRLHFIRTHLIDVIIVVFPQFQALRVLRAFNSDGILSKGKGALTGKALASGFMAMALVVWVGSLMVLSAERGARGAEITTFGDAVWWSFETITTVGYGDFVPVTWTGRIYATLVMLVGISVLGIVSASMAASLVKRGIGAGSSATAPTPAPAPDSTPAAATDVNEEVLKELAELKSMVSALQSQLAKPEGNAS